MNPRLRALEIIRTREPKTPTELQRPIDIFASHVFNTRMMKHYLSKDVYLKLKKAIEHGDTIDRETAGPVANAIKAWAIDRGANHFTHWFQPLTGLAAEKHDSFLEFSDGEPIEKFSGEELAQQEPDASSFPTGGLRSTFEARGYTAWDCSSPAFIFETRYGKTLCIPTIFVSYTGEALDYKIPLLKSMHLLEKAAVEVCNYFDRNVNRVTVTLGAEQEYFLIDEAYYDLRPDLLLTGRTLFGAPPARGQQLADHYFGSIPERVFAFMNQLEQEALRLGIPLKTRHNEVAPGQYECAPRFEELNVAVDHGQMLMDLMDRVARQHNLRCLLHEKPFAHINGSGKHNNWSMATDTGKNLLSPGANPRDNLMFLAFFTTVLRAVYEYADLLRASIASAGNDHRLGANEAPPAIISAFIGSQLSRVLEEVAEPPRRRRNESPNAYLKLGISKIPELLMDNTDRNRTSPFAFTGNKFEFRAVGSSANSAHAMAILNIIVAKELREFKRKVDGKIRRGRKKETAILDAIKENIEYSRNIVFEGDGYSDEWVQEAARRGLNNVKTTPHALDFFISPKAIALFTEFKLFSEEEAHARYEVLMDNYLNKVKIEAHMAAELTMTHIIPAAVSYQRELMESIEAAEDSGMSKAATAGHRHLAEKVGKHLSAIIEEVGNMNKAIEAVEALGGGGHGSTESVAPAAKAFCENVVPFFARIRSEVDALELLLPDNLWPLPKYREMLFVR